MIHLMPHYQQQLATHEGEHQPLAIQGPTINESQYSEPQYKAVA